MYYSDGRGWPIRVHRVPARLEGDAGNEEFSLPVFAVVLTKFKKMSSAMQVRTYILTNLSSLVGTIASLDL